MGYIALPSILNASVGITSYYCVILKIVVLHDGIKTIQNGPFQFSLKKEQNLVSFQKTHKMGLKKKQVGCFFKKTRVFLNPAFLTFNILNIFPMAALGTTKHVKIFPI